MQNNCECDNSMFIDKMCRECLFRVRNSALEAIAKLEDEIMEFDSTIDEVDFYLYG